MNVKNDYFAETSFIHLENFAENIWVGTIFLPATTVLRNMRNKSSHVVHLFLNFLFDMVDLLCGI